MSMSFSKHKALYSWCTNLCKLRGPILVWQVARAIVRRKKKWMYVECQLGCQLGVCQTLCWTFSSVIPLIESSQSPFEGERNIFTPEKLDQKLLIRSRWRQWIFGQLRKVQIPQQAAQSQDSDLSLEAPALGACIFKEDASYLTLPLQLLSDSTPFHKSWHVKKIIFNYFTYLLFFFFFFSRENV